MTQQLYYVIRRMLTHHQLPAVATQVQAVNILTKPLNNLLIPTKDIHIVPCDEDNDSDDDDNDVLTYDGGAVPIPLPWNVPLHQWPAPLVSAGAEGEELSD